MNAAIRRLRIFSLSLSMVACTADAPIVYDDSTALGEAILEAESARGESTWLDVGTLELPAWAEVTVSPWDERVAEMLDQLNRIHEDVLPGDPVSMEKRGDRVSSITQPLSDCSGWTQDCTPTIANITTCEYTAECGSAGMSWVFSYTPDAIVDTLSYTGMDGRWDYGGGHSVQSGTRMRDGKSLVFTKFMSPDHEGQPLFQYTWQVDDEATIYTPWGGMTQVFTVSVSSTIYAYDILTESVHPSLLTTMEATAPNGPVIFANEAWSVSRMALVPTYRVTFADGECAWASFNEDGSIRDTGRC